MQVGTGCSNNMHTTPTTTDQFRIGLDWIELDSLFIQRKHLAKGYYTRHPVKGTVDRNEKQNKKNFIIQSMWVCQCISGVRDIRNE